EFLCWVGISRNYLLNKDTYPRFEYEDGEAEVPKPQRTKKKRVIYDSEGLPVAAHPRKRLRADYGTIGGSVTRGKSPSVLNSFTFGGGRRSY
ncbi:hypothetical protein Tco_1396446, partial [Tanacetum coccineum]